jgi:hypothetical protein
MLSDPATQNSGVLPGAEVRRAVHSAREQEVVRSPASALDPRMHNAILMTNRILNGQLSDQERSKYMSALVETAKTPDLPKTLRDLAHWFLERRRTLDAEG